MWELCHHKTIPKIKYGNTLQNLPATWNLQLFPEVKAISHSYSFSFLSDRNSQNWRCQNFSSEAAIPCNFVDFFGFFFFCQQFSTSDRAKHLPRSEACYHCRLEIKQRFSRKHTRTTRPSKGDNCNEEMMKNGGSGFGRVWERKFHRRLT